MLENTQNTNYTLGSNVIIQLLATILTPHSNYIYEHLIWAYTWAGEDNASCPMLDGSSRSAHTSKFLANLKRTPLLLHFIP